MINFATVLSKLFVFCPSGKTLSMYLWCDNLIVGVAEKHV